jgi:hypothetical protein
MFGFLNVFIAAALAREGVGLDLLQRVLLEESPTAFAFSDAQIACYGYTLKVGDIADTRRGFAISFGSCSFEEPVADLISLGML